MTRQRKLHELVTVRVGALGVPSEGVGVVPVVLDLDTMDENAIGHAMARAFRQAHTEAVREFGPKLTEAWASDAIRFQEGDEEPETES